MDTLKIELTLQELVIVKNVLNLYEYKLGDAMLVYPIAKKLQEIIDANSPKEEAATEVKND